MLAKKLLNTSVLSPSVSATYVISGPVNYANLLAIFFLSLPCLENMIMDKDGLPEQNTSDFKEHSFKPGTAKVTP